MTAPDRLPQVLAGKKALMVGVANENSIAWGCAEATHRAGAEIAMTYLNDRAKPHVELLARRELARREAQEVLPRAAEGSVRDGIVRLVIMLLSDGAIDERGHRAMQAAWAGLPARFRGSQAEMRDVVRREALLLRTDRAAALRGLRAIFTDPEDRAVAETAFREAAAAVGARIDMTPDGSVARLLAPAERAQRVGA